MQRGGEAEVARHTGLTGKLREQHDQHGTPEREKPGISAGLFDKILISLRKDWRARRDSNS
jgi:hypothetical protein